MGFFRPHKVTANLAREEYGPRQPIPEGQEATLFLAFRRYSRHTIVNWPREHPPFQKKPWPKGSGMFDPNALYSKTSLPKANRPLLRRAGAPIEPKQRRMMVIALALLLATLGFVVFHDRDFWFPDIDEAQDTQDANPVAMAVPPIVARTTPPVAVAQAAAEPEKSGKKSHRSSSKAADARASRAKVKNSPRMAPAQVEPAAVDRGAIDRNPIDHSAVDRNAIAANVDTSDAPAGMTVTSRTALPPLEVEVVAGDNHRNIHPGTNAVKVEVQPDAAADTTPAPSTSTETAASVTDNAAERVQMSADTAKVVSRPVQPGYPTLARQMKVQGSVILRAFIGRDGLIQDLRVVSGPPILASAAEEAV